MSSDHLEKRPATTARGEIPLRVMARPRLPTTAVHFTTPHADGDVDAIPHPLFDALERTRTAGVGHRISTPWKRNLYALFESPTSSASAFLIHIGSTGLILFSAIITILETLPPFHSTPNGVWFGIETSLVVIFTVEYICRLLAHSENWSTLFRWARSLFAIVDLLAILPYYIEIAIQADTTAFFRFSILRTFRLLRVFRPFRYSNNILLTIEVMYLAVQRSKHALYALGFFVCMAVVLFSTLLYFAERGTWDGNLEAFVNSDGDPSQFESIPAAAWFVLVTITTVGYGEVIPRSFLGRLMTVPLLMFGLLLIALPSFVLGREFADVWESMGGSEMLRLTANRSLDRSEHADHDSEQGQVLMSISPDTDDSQPSPAYPPRASPTPRHLPEERSFTPPLSSATPPIGQSPHRRRRSFGMGGGTRNSLDDSGITNLKLAMNQQVLAAQLDKLLESVEQLKEEVRVLSSNTAGSSRR